MDGSKLGKIPPTMSMVVTWHRSRLGPLDMYLTRKALLNDILVIGVQQGKPSDCASRVSGCTFTTCKRPDGFPILHVRYVCFGGLFLMFFRVYITHWLLCKTDDINTKFNPVPVIYIWAHRWNLVLLLIYVDLFKHSNSSVPSAFQTDSVV